MPNNTFLQEKNNGWGETVPRVDYIRHEARTREPDANRDRLDVLEASIERELAEIEKKLFNSQFEQMKTLYAIPKIHIDKKENI